MFMRLTCSAILVSVLGASVLSADDSDFKADSKKLMGKWAPIENIINGERTPEEILKPRPTVVLDGKYENYTEGKIENTGTWKFVAKKGKVLHLDLAPVDGEGKGKVVKCIVEFISDDEWKLCMPFEPDGERPTEFTSTKEVKQILRTYKRVKE
jgi:uncharacterized protein (TIGR03067 family)